MEKPLRILMLSDVYFPYTSGVVTAVYNLTEGLVKEGCEVMLVVPKVEGGAKASRGNPRILTVPSLPAPVGYKLRLAVPVSLKLWREVKRFRPDVIHAQTPGGVAWEAKLLARRLSVPFVGTEHTYIVGDDWMRMIGIGPRWDRAASKVVVEYLDRFHRSDAATTVGSQSLKKGLAAAKSIAQAEVISNVVDYSHCRRVSQAEVRRLKAKLGLTEKVMIYVGRLSSEKRVEMLVAALAEVRRQDDQVSLLLVGGGPEEPKLRTMAERLGVGDKVVITGLVAYDRLLSKGYFQLGDVFVSASVYENQPMSVLEAMWFGLPLLVVDSAGLAELVEGNGEVFAKGNMDELVERVVKILGDKRLRAEYGRRSRRLARTKYGRKQVTNQYIALYKRVLSRKKLDRVKSTPVSGRRQWQVSVVVPAFNEEKYLGRCLQSLTKQTVEPREIIVVDNNSTDRTVEIARQFGVRVVRERVQGTTPARNRGFDEVKTEIIARCDADCRVPEDWVERVRDQFRRYRIEGLGGPIEFDDLGLKVSTAKLAKQYMKFLKLICRSEVMIGPNMSLTREVWQQVRSKVELDDGLVHEDLDLSLRIYHAGGKIRFDEDLVVASSARRLYQQPFSLFGEYQLRTIKTLLYNLRDRSRGKVGESE